MKLLAILVLSVLSFQASATSLAPLECTYGEIGQDNYAQISLLSGTVGIQMHETFIDADQSQTQVVGDAVSILGKKLKSTSEGEESEADVTGLFVYDQASHTLNVTLIIDNYTHFAAETFTCK